MDPNNEPMDDFLYYSLLALFLFSLVLFFLPIMMDVPVMEIWEWLWP